MGIFRKIFSIGSKKSKKRPTVKHATPPPTSPPSNLKVAQQEEEAEAEVSRLLRSSSARLAIHPQLTLPPLSHPIDNIVPSLPTTTPSFSTRSTYSVSVHGRTIHSRTEFPNAFPPMDQPTTPKRSLTDSARRRAKSVPMTPRDQSRLLKLRQDPSIANLLDHYDDQGYLDSCIFSNSSPSPSQEGGLQRRRTGSTLRQLLGHPSSPNGSSNGDISWAEKFLGESDGNSSVPSSGLSTPADTHFTDTHLAQTDRSVTLSLEYDSAVYHHTFSSLEVELSVSTDQAHQPVHDRAMTPQKASEIFGFLTERKKVPESRPPFLHPQSKSTPRLRPDSPPYNYPSRIPRCDTRAPRSTPSPTQLRFSIVDTRESPGLVSSTTVVGNGVDDPPLELPNPHQPITVQNTGHSGRGPRGPRALSTIPLLASSGVPSVAAEGIVPASGSDAELRPTDKPATIRSALGAKSNASALYPSPACTPATKSHIPKLRTTSDSTVASVGSMKEGRASSTSPTMTSASPPRALPINASSGNNTVSILPLPVTPVRPPGFRPRYLAEPPSPTSSSELSPVAKQLMANLRHQRMQARQRDRQTGRLGSCQSRIRY